jgi:chaperonin cofactor prefoldin
MSDVEKDFSIVAEQINAKLKEAADALREANRLKDEANMPALIGAQWLAEELYGDEREAFREKVELINVRALEAQLGQAGWSTSSSYC